MNSYYVYLIIFIFSIVSSLIFIFKSYKLRNIQHYESIRDTIVKKQVKIKEEPEEEEEEESEIGENSIGRMIGSLVGLIVSVSVGMNVISQSADPQLITQFESMSTIFNVLPFFLAVITLGYVGFIVYSSVYK
jgi:uncharacterized BrkB/YihY/UPF0761 family membrane protein